MVVERESHESRKTVSVPRTRLLLSVQWSGRWQSAFVLAASCGFASVACTTPEEEGSGLYVNTSSKIVGPGKRKIQLGRGRGVVSGKTAGAAGAQGWSY